MSGRQTLFGDEVATGCAEFESPEWVFKLMDEQFHFELDVCAIAANAKCARFYSPQDDGLSKPWVGNCWMNPPYGKEITKWVEKAAMSRFHGATVVALLPARTNAPWWAAHVIGAAHRILFVRGKLKFPNPYGATGIAPWGSAVAIYTPRLFRGTICGVLERNGEVRA